MDIFTFILFFLGFGLLISGAEILVRGASRLAVAIGISPLVVGLTVVAYGTSAPELAVTIQSTYAGQNDIAIGNVVGSNIANVLLILGVSASITPLTVSRQLVRWDIPIMIGLSIMMFLMALDGRISQLDGILLVAGAVAYTIIAIRQSRRNNTTSTNSDEAGQAGDKIPLSQVFIRLGYIVVGLGLLVLGSRWLINGAVAVARLLGASELIIGLTIIAVGTSLPEIATSIAAGIRGERDIAVGNAVGSNIFNILLVLGLCSTVSPAGVVVPGPALRFDIPVMVAIMLACLPVFFTGYQIARWEGFLFLGYYIAYTVYLFLNATQHSALPAFSWIMITYVVPITVVTLLVLAIRAIRTNHHNPVM